MRNPATSATLHHDAPRSRDRDARLHFAGPVRRRGPALADGVSAGGGRRTLRRAAAHDRLAAGIDPDVRPPSASCPGSWPGTAIRERATPIRGPCTNPCPGPGRSARIRDRAAELCGARFNAVLLNLYRDGRDGMGWHADDEAELGRDPVIASVSLGATRRFCLRHRQTQEPEARRAAAARQPALHVGADAASLAARVAQDPGCGRRAHQPDVPARRDYVVPRIAVAVRAAQRQASSNRVRGLP